MLVVCGISDAEWLLENWRTMFPGAPMPLQPDANSRTGTAKDRTKAFLLDLPASVLEIAAEQVAVHLGSKPWRAISSNLMAKRFREVTLPAIGWRYETRRVGRSTTGWFVRSEAESRAFGPAALPRIAVTQPQSPRSKAA
jgi:hypothetical protein